MKRICEQVSLLGRQETISLMEFRRRPGEVFASVMLGKSFLLTKSGTVIALLCPPPCDLSRPWFPKRKKGTP